MPSSDVPLREFTGASVTISLVDLTDVLGRMVFVSSSRLERGVELATRGADGRWDWIALQGDFHAEVLGHCIGAVWRSDCGRVPVSMIRRAMFEMMRILNGQEAAIFRLDQKVAQDHNRVNRERKRLARKRRRAAKRERARELELVTRSTARCKSSKAQSSRPGRPDRKVGTKCAQCGKSFRSRKRRDRHVCHDPDATKKGKERGVGSAAVVSRVGVRLALSSGGVHPSQATRSSGTSRPTRCFYESPLSGQSLEDAVVRLENAAARRVGRSQSQLAVPTSLLTVVPTVGPAPSARAPTQATDVSVTVGSRLSLPPSSGSWVYDAATGWTERRPSVPSLEEIEEALRQTE